MLATVRRLGSLTACLTIAALSGFSEQGQGAEAPPTPVSVRSPLSPEQARRAFHLAPGLHIELVACEPAVESPVAMAFDEEGKLWVVEMRDYPNGPPPGRPPEGRIRILEDRDGDGRYETASVFADHLLFANGLMPWRGGAFVTAAPHLFFLHDDRRRGRAERCEILFEGFATENPQLRVNHPVLALDNRVYVSNGLRGGRVRRAGRPDAPTVNLSSMDFRFDPIKLGYEAVTGMGQFGNTFDDWGRRFVCTNRNHVIPIVFPNRYAARNPYLAPPEPARDDQSPGGSARVFPLSHNWTTAASHAGSFTSCCGIAVYRGDLLPAEFRGAVFTCEPAGNLVHQEILTPDGAGFRWHRAREGVEFLASPDDWFRPVNLADGPDGALYLVDMYRAVIEHPQYMPADVRDRPDLTWGKQRGRIWRIVPDGPRARPKRPHLSTATTPELVALLTHADAWWRTTAQRLLLERQDHRAVEPLRKLAAGSEQPLARLHAAWLLAALDALDEPLALQLLGHPHPRLREHAVALAERWLAKSSTIQARLLELAGDPDARLRYQVALSLGEWESDRILAPLARIALAGAEDRWTRMAVASAVPHRAGSLIVALFAPALHLTEHPSPARLLLLQELATCVGARRDPQEVATVLEALPADKAAWQVAVLNGLADGMGRRGTQLGTFLASLPSANRSAAERAAALLGQAAAAATGRRRDLGERLAAVRLLAHTPWPQAEPVLRALLTGDPSVEVRLAAVRALAAHSRDEAAEVLLRSWASYPTALRREAGEALLRRPAWILAFLREVEAGRIRPTDLDPQRLRQLVNHSRLEVRERARKLLQASLPADRKPVVERYRAALTLKGDPLRGKAVFQKHCATCHRLAGVGVTVGPDIGDVVLRTREALLVDILDPNAAIDGNYINYLVTTKSGRILTGIITAESDASITLRRAENQTDVVLRQDIEEIQSSGQSLMPEDLDKVVSIPEMADLLEFLKNWRLVETTARPAGG
jgi:putative membrane-bound dehydrogenase-like protein